MAWAYPVVAAICECGMGRNAGLNSVALQRVSLH